MSDQQVDSGKRTWLIASGCAGAVGAGFVAVPFVSSFQPSERARAAGAPVEVDISGIKPGEKLTVEWRGKPVWIVRRTPEQLAALPKLDAAARRPELEAQARRADAAVRAQRVALDQARDPRRASASARTWAARRATSSSPGAQPSLPDDWDGGFLCPCHGSTFDMAGRVYKNKPAPDNLKCRRTCTCPTRGCSSAKTRRPEHGATQG